MRVTQTRMFGESDELVYDSERSDPFAGLPADYPCRTCGDPSDFEHGVERCDDQPCERLVAYIRLRRRRAKWAPGRLLTVEERKDACQKEHERGGTGRAI